MPIPRADGLITIELTVYENLIKACKAALNTFEGMNGKTYLVEEMLKEAIARAEVKS